MKRDRLLSLKVVDAALLGTLALLGTGAVPSVVAQQPTAQLEEIVVTSRRRSESLQDIPDAVTAFSSQMIEDAGINDIDDISKMTPGLWFSGDQHVGASNITMRGMTQNRNQDPPVAIVVDGVTLGTTLLFSQDLFDIEQIEVLRGPQGALYGRNSMGGAIVINTKAPSNDPSYKFKLGYGKSSAINFAGTATGPIIEDKLRYRATVNFQDSDGLIENITYGEKIDAYNAESARFRFLYAASDRMDIEFRASLANRKGSGGPWKADTADGQNVLVPAASSPTGQDELIIAGQYQSDLIGRGEVTSKEFSLKIDYDLGFADLTSITAYTDISQYFETDLDYTRLVTTTATVDPEEDQIIMQEFRLTSPSDQRLRWLAGAFYQNDDRFKNIDVFSGTLSFLPNPVPVAQVPADTESTAYAFFGQVNYDITDDLELTLAGRWDRDERDQHTQGFNETFTKFQPKVSLAYKATDNINLFATYAVGFRPGGFNATDEFGLVYASEETENYEVGVKSTLFDGAMRLNVNAYQIDLTGQQFFLFSENGGQSLANLESSEIKGIEAELNLTLPAGFDINAALAVTDAKLLEFGDFDGLNTDLLDPDAVAGNKLNHMPENTFSIGLQHQMPINDFNLITRIDVQRQGRLYWFLDNVETQEAFTLVNARIKLEKDDWSISAFVNNATDAEYDTYEFIGRFINSRFGINPALQGPPIHYGVELEMSF